MEYRYSLRKNGKKLRCPSCGRIGEFVPYVDENNKKINYIMLCILNNYTYLYNSVARLTLATKRNLSLVRIILKSDAIFFFRGFTFYMYYE